MSESTTAKTNLSRSLPVRLLLPLVIGIGGIAFLTFFSVFEFKDAMRGVEEKGQTDVSVMMSNLQAAIAYRLRQGDIMPGVQNVIANQSFQEQIKDVVFINNPLRRRVPGRTTLLYGSPV